MGWKVNMHAKKMVQKPTDAELKKCRETYEQKFVHGIDVSCLNCEWVGICHKSE